jgi:hypothetical protein
MLWYLLWLVLDGELAFLVALGFCSGAFSRLVVGGRRDDLADQNAQQAYLD